MKILHVISTANPVGGGPIEGVAKLSQAMRKLGAEMEVATCDDPCEPFVEKFPVRLHALGPKIGKYHYASRIYPWLKDNLENYDVVVINGLWQYHGLAAYRALRSSSTPYFVFTHGMLDPWFKKTYPMKHLKKFLYWILFERWLLKRAKKVIFTCEEEKVLARNSFFPYTVNETVTSYGTSSPPDNYLELAGLFRRKNPELNGKRIILFLSRIQEKKGCDMLLKAFSKIVKNNKSLHLVMAGPDQEGWSRTLKEMACSLGIESAVSWMGMLQGDDKWGAFYSCDAFCLPSHQENFGIVVAEALGCGKPVLISNKVNIWREIESARAGFVDDDTVEGTKRNIERWLDMSENELVEMGERARVCFLENFHIEIAAKRLIEIMSEKD